MMSADGSSGSSNGGGVPSARQLSRKQSMSVREKLLMSPWEKWKKYNRFPWKFVLHIALVVLTWSQVLVVSRLSSYVRATNRNWNHFFFPDDHTPGSVSYLYSINDTRSAFQKLSESYFSINETSLAGESQAAPIHLTVLSLNPKTRSGRPLVTTTYSLSQGDLGPLSWDLPREDALIFFRRLRRMTALFPLRDERELAGICLHWKIEVAFDLANDGQLGMTLARSVASRCEGSKLDMDDSLFLTVALNVVLLCVAGAYEVLVAIALLRSYRLYTIAKHRLTDQMLPGVDMTPRRPLQWKSLPLLVKIKFFNMGFIISGLGCLLVLITSTAMVSFRSLDWLLSEYHRITLGLGCALLCVSLVGYMEHNKGFYSVVITLRLGVPRVLQFLVGVMPLFFGYALFGVAYFGAYSQRFSSITSAMIFLFAVLNGDSIRDSFDELVQIFPFVSQLYLYSFISLFMYIVLNMFIAIMEEAFFASRDYKRTIEKFSDYKSEARYPASNPIQRETGDKEEQRPPVSSLSVDPPEVTTGELFRRVLQQLES